MKSAMNDLTVDAILGGRLRLAQPARGHRAGSDAVLAAAAVPARPGEALADFGAGVGTIGLAVLARVPDSRALLVEIDPATARLASENALANTFDRRVRVVTGDVAAIGLGETADLSGVVDHVVSNPPFNPASGRRSPDMETARARVGDPDLLDIWTRTAARLLRHGGSFTLIHRPDALNAILAALEGRFGGVALRFIQPVAEKEAVRVIVQARKDSRAPLKVLPSLILNRTEGGFTAEAEALHRDLTALDMSGH